MPVESLEAVDQCSQCGKAIPVAESACVYQDRTVCRNCHLALTKPPPPEALRKAMAEIQRPPSYTGTTVIAFLWIALGIVSMLAGLAEGPVAFGSGAVVVTGSLLMLLLRDIAINSFEILKELRRR